MSEKPILYINPLSPPSRAVLLTGAALGIEFDVRNIDLAGLEHRTPEYIKVSPFLYLLIDFFFSKKKLSFLKNHFSSKDE